MLFLKVFAIVLLVFFLGLIGLKAGLRIAMRRMAENPEFKAEMARYHASREAEQTTREEADWFGTTGLSDEDEREVPRYLRREFGELMQDEGALQARDLRYVGRYDEEHGPVHYWRIPRRGDDAPCYAYFCEDDEGGCLSWGGREPPARAPDVPAFQGAP